MHRLLSPAVTLIAVLALAACKPPTPPAPPAPPPAIVSTGYDAGIDGYRIREGGALVTIGRPLVILGQYQAPDKPVEMTYVVLVRHGRSDPRTGAEVSGAAHMTPDRGGGSATVSLGDDAVRIEHERGGTESGGPETLTVNGAPIDLDVGRVVLVDLTTDPPRQRTVEAELNPGGPWPTDAAGMERLARHLLDDLANRYAMVRGFVLTGPGED